MCLQQIDASEAQRKTKKIEMSEAQRLKYAYEKKSGQNFCRRNERRRMFTQQSFFADGKLACVVLSDEKKLIQEQRPAVVQRAKLNLTSSLDESAHDSLEKKREIDFDCENAPTPSALMGEAELAIGIFVGCLSRFVGF